MSDVVESYCSSDKAYVPTGLLFPDPRCIGLNEDDSVSSFFRLKPDDRVREEGGESAVEEDSSSQESWRQSMVVVVALVGVVVVALVAAIAKPALRPALLVAGIGGLALTGVVWSFSNKSDEGVD
jgi:hypothetical protein